MWLDKTTKDMVKNDVISIIKKYKLQESFKQYFLRYGFTKKAVSLYCREQHWKDVSIEQRSSYTYCPSKVKANWYGFFLKKSFLSLDKFLSQFKLHEQD